MAKKVTIKGKGKKPVTSTRGVLPNPDAAMRSAMVGHYGMLAQKQANMAMGMLKKGRKTAAKNRKKARK